MYILSCDFKERGQQGLRKSPNTHGGKPKTECWEIEASKQIIVYRLACILLLKANFPVLRAVIKACSNNLQDCGPATQDTHPPPAPSCSHPLMGAGNLVPLSPKLETGF